MLAAAFAIASLRTAPIDLSVYRAGARDVLDGMRLYQGPVWAGLDFTYPPLAAVLFIPLAVLPAIIAQAVVCVVNLVLLGWICRRSLIAVGVAPGPSLTALVLVAGGVLFWLDSVRTTVYLGQVNLALLALVLGDLLRPDSRRTKGIGVGIAAGIKLTPLIFILFLLVTRRFRAAGTAIGVFVSTVVVGFVVVPHDAARYWLDGQFADAARVFPDPGSPHNQSLYGLLARLTAALSLWWAALAVVAVAGTLVLAAMFHKRGEELLALTLCGLAAPAVSPYAWNHHWVWLVPLAVFLAHRVCGGWHCTAHAHWLAPALALVLVLPWIAGLTNPPIGAPVLAHSLLAFVLGNPYVVCYVLVLACAAWDLLTIPADHARRRTHGESPEACLMPARRRRRVCR